MRSITLCTVAQESGGEALRRVEAGREGRRDRGRARALESLAEVGPVHSRGSGARRCVATDVSQAVRRRRAHYRRLAVKEREKQVKKDAF